MDLQIPSPSSTLSLPNFVALNTIKLTNTNFPIWKKQISSCLKAHQLFGFADGTKPSPPHESSPAFLEWFSKDNLVSAILNSSLSEPIMTQVYECTTAQEIWARLHSLFAAKPNAQIIQTRLQLASLKKGSGSITEYFNKAKAHVSAIQSAGHAIGDDEFVVYLFAGLRSDYDSIVSSLSTQPTLPLSEQVLFYLMNHETKLARQTSTSILGAPPLYVNSTITQLEANFTSTRGGQGSYTGSSNNRGASNGSRFTYESIRNSSSGGRGSFSNSGRGRGLSFSGEPDNRPICQLCDRRRHTALKCWYRFDQAFQAPPPRSFQAHSTVSSWYPDTAANQHYTPDLSNLRLDSLLYNGTDQVAVGDGSTIPIRNHGPADSTSSSFGPR